MVLNKSYRPRRNRKGAVAKARKQARNAKPNKMSIVQVRQLIKQGIHRQAENKLAVTDLSTISPALIGTPLNIYGSGVDWNGTTGTVGLVFSNIFPNLILGSGQGAREGNKIEPRYFTLRGVLTTQEISTAVNPTVAPFYVHMFIYRKKGNIFDSDTTKILQVGAGQGSTTSAGNSGPFDGSLLKSTYPMNRDLYNVYKHRVFKMAYAPQGVITSQPTGTVTQQLSDGWGNGFRMSHIFKIRVPVKKTWKYNDSDTNYPTNDNFNVAFAVVNADGTKNLAITARCNLVMESVLSFEDV